MSSIQRSQAQYLSYILTNTQTPARLEVVPERGGIITRWSVQGQEILYLDEARFADPQLSVRGGIPILFPICGNLPDNTYTYEGRPYTLKQHGFARDLPWRVSDQTTEGPPSITLVLESSEQTRQFYPFDFVLTFTYRLLGNSLVLHQKVSNLGSAPMPFSLGLHPYFEVADKSNLQFEIPATQFEDQRSHHTHTFLGGFDFALDEIDVIFHDPSAAIATATDIGRQLKLTLEYSEPYTSLVFWTVQGKDFYCLEPWSAPRNAMNTGDRLTQLAPGKSLETTVRLTASFL